MYSDAFLHICLSGGNFIVFITSVSKEQSQLNMGKPKAGERDKGLSYSGIVRDCCVNQWGVLFLGKSRAPDHFQTSLTVELLELPKPERRDHILLFPQLPPLHIEMSAALSSL